MRVVWTCMGYSTVRVAWRGQREGGEWYTSISGKTYLEQDNQLIQTETISCEMKIWLPIKNLGILWVLFRRPMLFNLCHLSLQLILHCAKSLGKLLSEWTTLHSLKLRQFSGLPPPLPKSEHLCNWSSHSVLPEKSVALGFNFNPPLHKMETYS